jgi:hypothetical protein
MKKKMKETEHIRTQKMKGRDTNRGWIDERLK